jgi:hypothetical protein
LCNDTNDDDNDITPTNLSKVSESITGHVKRDRKKNHKKRSVKNEVHNLLILGDSHTRGCASEVRNQLNNEYEIWIYKPWISNEKHKRISQNENGTVNK